MLKRKSAKWIRRIGLLSVMALLFFLQNAFTLHARAAASYKISYLPEEEGSQQKELAAIGEAERRTVEDMERAPANNIAIGTLTLNANNVPAEHRNGYCISSTPLVSDDNARVFQMLFTGRLINDQGRIDLGGYADGIYYLYVEDIPEELISISQMKNDYYEVFKINYISQKSEDVTVTLTKGTGTEEDPDGTADVGDTIHFESPGTDMIFYTTNGVTPIFYDVVSEEVKEKLNAKAGGASGVQFYDTEAFGDDKPDVTRPNRSYLYVNKTWYYCSESVKKLGDGGTIQVSEEIRKNNYFPVYALSVTQGRTIGNYTYRSFRQILRLTVAKPTVSGLTVDPDTGQYQISMGDSIYFNCETAESKMFYTTNKTAPVVRVDGSNQLVAGNSATKEYTNRLIISEDIAEYGKTFTVMIRGYNYGQDGYKIMNNSELAECVFAISANRTIESVTSVPATTASEIATVKAGSKIQLYPVETGITIFYTIDGSEPSFSYSETDGFTWDQETEITPSVTYRYDSTKGVTVPEAVSSLFTITAVATDGYATSKSSQLVFQYPGAIYAPYATPSSGNVSENQEIVLKSATEGAVIFYEISTDMEKEPEEPTAASSVYSADQPILITRDTKIRACAVKDGLTSAVSAFHYTVSEKLSVPTPSLTSGSVVPKGSTVSFTAGDGATIYYTTDGSNPKDAANKKVVIGNSVLLDAETGTIITIRVYASRTNYSDSETGVYSYTISSFEGGIFADKETGSTVKNGETIRLSTDVTGAKIYYTTDGSTPSTSSKRGDSLTISGEPGATVTVKAIAVSDGANKTSFAATFTYTIVGKSKTVKSSVPSGAVFTEPGEIVLSAEAGTIYYTTDGLDPTSGSTLFKDSISVTKAMTIRAIAVEDGMDASDIATFTYSFADQVAEPRADHQSGELEIGTEVRFICETEDAILYYTTNGTDPDPSDTSTLNVYTGPITIDRAMTIKIIATKNHMQNSRITTAGYTVKEIEILEPEVESEQKARDTGGRLMSRRSFSESGAETSFEDVILRNAAYGAVVSAKTGVLPENVRLSIEKVSVSQTADNIVKQNIHESYGIVASYEVALTVDGESVQPEGDIEIGLPIPSDYENSIIYIVYVEDDGTIEVWNTDTKATRRSGGMAYAITDHLSAYSIVAPVDFDEAKSSSFLKILLIGIAGVAGILGFTALGRGGRRKRRQGKTK